MSATPTLFYFKGRGRGEPARLLLTLAGVDFNDHRFAAALTPEIREKFTYGQVPFYQDDDIELAQSLAIEFYIANKYHFNGDNLVDQAKILSISQSSIDFVLPFFFSDTVEKKDTYKNETVPRLLAAWEKLLTANGGKYIVGNKLSWADVNVYYVLDFLVTRGYTELVEKNPNLAKSRTNFESIPSIKEYITKRVELEKVVPAGTQAS